MCGIPINANLGNDRAVGEGTIIDVRPLVVTVSDAYAVEGEEAGFIVKLNIEAPETINLHYTTRDGTALSGPDGSGDYEYDRLQPPRFLGVHTG